MGKSTQNSLPTPGVLGSLFWAQLKLWLNVPTSIIAGCMLPLAYIGFLKLQTSEAYLGKPVLSSAAAMLWNALRTAGIATTVPGCGRLLADPSLRPASAQRRPRRAL